MDGSKKPVVIYGAGGHGKVVLDALERCSRTVLGFVDDDASGAEHCGYAVFASLDGGEVGDDVEVVVAIGDAAARERVTARVREAGYDLATVVHASATIGRDAVIGPGVMILAQAAVNPGCRLGQGTIINTGATVDHDCLIGDFAHVGPGARVAGGVMVGDRVLIGVGASLIPGVKIGSDAVVGAGAVVIGDVEAGVTVAGCPAKRILPKVHSVSPRR